MATETTQEIEFVETNPPRKIEMFPSDSKQQLRQQIIYSMEEVKFKFHNLRLNTLEQRSYYIYPACHGRFILVESLSIQIFCQRLYYIQKDGTMISYVQTRGLNKIQIFSEWEVLIIEQPTKNSVHVILWNLQINQIKVVQQIQDQYYSLLQVFPNKRIVCVYKEEKYKVSLDYYLYQHDFQVKLIRQYDVPLLQECDSYHVRRINKEDGIALYSSDDKNPYIILCKCDGYEFYRVPIIPILSEQYFYLDNIIQVNKGRMLFEFTKNYSIPNTKRVWPQMYSFLWDYSENTWSDYFPINSNNFRIFLRSFRPQNVLNYRLTSYELKNAIFIDYQNLQILGSNKECNFDGFVSNPVYDETLFTYLDYSECDLDAQVIPMTVRTVKFNKLVEICTFLLCELIPNIDEDILYEINKIII